MRVHHLMRPHRLSAGRTYRQLFVPERHKEAFMADADQKSALPVAYTLWNGERYGNSKI